MSISRLQNNEHDLILTFNLLSESKLNWRIMEKLRLSIVEGESAMN